MNGQKPRDDFGAMITAHTDRYGKCPIEAGLIGNLADHECRHGNLPGDRNLNCRCFHAKKGAR